MIEATFLGRRKKKHTTKKFVICWLGLAWLGGAACGMVGGAALGN